MLIFPPFQFQVDRGLNHCVRLCGYVFGMLASVMLLLFFLFGPVEESPIKTRELRQKNAGTLFAYEAIGSGGLALHPRYALGWVSRLAEELALIAYNSRPDCESKDAKFLLSLKSGKQLFDFSNGRTLFLKEAQQGKGLAVSEEPTGLWIKPILLENGAVLVEAGRMLTSIEGQSGDERGEFIISPQGGIPSRYNPSQQGFIKEFKTAHYFSQDLLIQKYGGKEFSGWKDKAVLELSRGSSSYACFVTAGDYLLYEDGEWRIASSFELKKDLPVAQVKSITARGLEIEVWDETGFYPIHISLEAEKPARFQPKAEIMPTAIRIRSATQISCALGKRRMILKQGDWLLKTASGWRNLRRAEEIEQYLNHRLKGDLLIFDSIEKEQGRLVMKGNLFDETRTHVVPISLPIDSEKTAGKTTRKRKSGTVTNSERRAA